MAAKKKVKSAKKGKRTKRK